MIYRERLMDGALQAALKRAGAVLIQGAKGSGKTSTAQQAAASQVRVDVDPRVELFMQTDPTQVLAGQTPRLIDEWQRQPKLWDLVRRAVDDRQLAGQFILTGSATPVPSVPRHSGAGRFAILNLRPMTLWELGLSSGEYSLASISNGEDLPTSNPDSLSLPSWAELIARGGWPSVLDKSVDQAMDYVMDYLTLIAEAEVTEVAGVRRDPIKVRRLMSSLARNTAAEASISTMSQDAGGPAGPLKRETVAGYVEMLQRLMIVEPLPAWQTALRNSARLRQAPKWHFVDPSLAVAALQARPDQLVAEPKTLGLLFESLATRDLRVYSETGRGRLYHARDSTGREIDAIVEYPHGWVACEIKLGMGQVEQAVANLERFTAVVDTQTVGPCLAKLVIVGAGPGYTRSDGINVVPLTCLRP